MFDLSDYTFDIRDVARLLNLKVRHKNPQSWDADCPFCGNRKGKLNINTAKNVFRCNYCGEHGGMLALYAGMYNLTNKEAYDGIIQALHLGTEVPAYTVTETKKEKAEFVNADRASREEVDRTYRMFLSFLTLSGSHRENLHKRGLSVGQMEAQMYRSTPVFGFRQLTERLMDAGCTVKGVPGFYQDEDGYWTLNVKVKNSGFFIPVVSEDGYMQGMQIRLDRPYNGMKYIWLSSVNRPYGVTSGSPVHFIGNLNDPVIYITEGAMKGSIAHYLTGRSFLCVAGVSQYKNLPSILSGFKERGLSQVVESYDMDKVLMPVCRGDYSENCVTCASRQTDGECPRKQKKLESIQRGCMHLYQICSRLMIPCIRLVWDMDEWGYWQERIKGIDDYAFSQIKNANKT